MPICSYLVIPGPAGTRSLAPRLAALPGCEVVPAENAEVLILVTETDGSEADERLRREIESLEDVQALVLTFGEVDPDTTDPDPLGRNRRRPGLPVLPPLPAGNRSNRLPGSSR